MTFLTQTTGKMELLLTERRRTLRTILFLPVETYVNQPQSHRQGKEAGCLSDNREHSYQMTWSVSPQTMTVLVSPGCYSRRPQTGWLVNKRDLFLPVLQAGESKTRCWQIQCLMRTRAFWFLSSGSSHGEGSQGLSYKATNPFDDGVAS